MTSQTHQQRRQQEQCPVLKIDRQGRFVYIDARTEQLLGVSAEELFVKNIKNFLDKESYDRLRRILDSGRSCEAFYYPLEANITDSSGRVLPYSAVVSQNFVAGNPANYQLILVPRPVLPERSEVYSAVEGTCDIWAAMAQVIAASGEGIDFQKLAEVVVTDEQILSIEIYRLADGIPVLLSSASRRPYSGAENSPAIIGNDILTTLLTGQKVTRPSSLASDETLASCEKLVETGLPIVHDNRVIGLVRLIHEPEMKENASLPEQLARFLGCLLPASAGDSKAIDDTIIGDVAAKAIFNGMKPLLYNIDENVNRISEQFSRGIKGCEHEFIDNIKGSSAGLNGFLQRFKTCFYIEPGDGTAYQKTDLNRVFRDVYQKLSQKYTGQNVFLKNVSLPIINTDEGRIHGIFEEILSNSFRFHDRNETLEIEVISRSSGSELTLCLGDNGPGFPANFAEDIFKPFRVVSEPGHPYPQGPGMGLAIARNLARSLKGDIRLGTPNGRGTVMEIILPNQ